MTRNCAQTVMDRGKPIRMCSATHVMGASGYIVRNARGKAKDGLGNVLCVMGGSRLSVRLVKAREGISCHSPVRNVTGRGFASKDGNDDIETKEEPGMAAGGSCLDCCYGRCDDPSRWGVKPLETVASRKRSPPSVQRSNDASFWNLWSGSYFGW